MNISLSGLDIVFLILIAFAALRAGIRGFVHEFLSMAAVLLGIGTAVLFSGIAAQLLQPYLGGGTWSQVVAFLGLFLVVYVVVKLFENALNRVIERINLESLDRALGFFLGIAEGLFLVFVLVLILQLQPVFDVEQLLLESEISRFLIPLLPYAERALDVGI